MTIFDRYVAKRFLYIYGVLFVSAFGLYVVIDGFTNIDHFQDGAGGPGEAMWLMVRYYTFQSSMFFDMAGPTLAVISTMIVLTTLIRNSEVQPIFAAGIPVFRLLSPLVLGAIVISAALTANREFVIPKIAYEIRARKSPDSDGHAVEPAYDNESHIHIAGARLHLKKREMEDAEFTLPVPDISHELITLKAPTARYFRKTANRPSAWLLEDVTPKYSEVPLTPDGHRRVLPAESPDDLYVVSDIDANMLYDSAQSFRFVSTFDLIRRIRNPAYSMETIRSQMLHLHLRMTKPLLIVIGVLITVPMILMKESRNLVGNVAGCTVTLGLLFGVGQGFEYLGSANLISTHLAAWGTVVFHGTVGAGLYGMVQT